MNVTENTQVLIPYGIDPRAQEPILDQALKTALDDEYKAYETYLGIIETFGAQAPFASIIEAEKRHQNALLELFARHGIAPIENQWLGNVQIPNSLEEAYVLGAEIEIANIAMYDTLLSYTQHYPDVQEVFFRLQAASFNNHLPAFQRCAMPQQPSVVQNATHQAHHMTQDAMASVENMSEQMNEWSRMAGKLAQGDFNQEDIFKLLSGNNVSFLAGALLGAVGAGMLGAMSQKNNQTNEDEEE